MTKFITGFVIAMTLAIFPMFVRADEQPVTSDDDAVKSAITHFYDALNVLFTGDAAPMNDVWSRADDVTYMGPGGGLQVGWTEVSAEWEKQAALKLGGHVTPEDLHITIGQDIAVTEGYEKGENTNAEGTTQTVSIRATNVFRKENGAWKMIGHHTDLLPYLAK